jgi:hypothetical protein
MSNLLKDKDYNRDLRAQILICSIREEEAASEILKNLLRLVKPNSKTLDNKSSSLSFKNKIDLLYDIDDLNKDDYTSLLKFMEIRNQFIHNPNCSSFNDLEKESPDSAKYLKATFENKIEDSEKSYVESFRKLFTRTLGLLLVLNLEYTKGSTNEMHRFIDAKTLENFDLIFKAAYDHWLNVKMQNPPAFIGLFPNEGNSIEDVKDFERYLQFYILEEKIKLLDKIINSEVTSKDIFVRRADLLKEFKKEQSKISEKGN